MRAISAMAPRHFDAGRPRADHDEGHERFPRRGVFHLLRGLERHEHPASNLERVVQALEARREFLPFRVAEVGVPGARRDDEIIVIDLSVRGDHFFQGRIDPPRFGEDHFGILLVAKDVAERLGDIRGRKRRGGHLIKQGLEEMMILAIQQGDARVDVAQPLRYFEASETSTDDNDARQ